MKKNIVFAVLIFGGMAMMSNTTLKQNNSDPYQKILSLKKELLSILSNNSKFKTIGEGKYFLNNDSYKSDIEINNNKITVKIFDKFCSEENLKNPESLKEYVHIPCKQKITLNFSQGWFEYLNEGIPEKILIDDAIFEIKFLVNMLNQ